MSRMHLSPPGSKTRFKPRTIESGFSLIELLMVIVIIGILVGIFSLSLGNFAEDESEEGIRRLQALIELARDEGSIQGREFGLMFYQQGYEFSLRGKAVDEAGNQLYDEDGRPIIDWFPVEDDRQFRPRSFDEESFIDLELEGKQIVLNFERDNKNEYIPHVYIWSSGEIEPPFKVAIRKTYSETGVELEYDLNGVVEPSNADE